MLNITRIPAPRVAIVDSETGLMSREWFRFFNNIYTIVGANLGVIQIENGGTGLSTLPTNGQLLIGDTVNGYVLNTLNPADGITVTNGAGTITLTNTGVLSFSADSTGLTPAVATTGHVVIGGLLNVVSGGTGQSSYTNGQLLIGNTTGNTLTKSTLTAGTAIGISNGAGAITITNTLPDQTVVLTNGTGISITGTYPSFTITNTSPSSGGTVTSVAALTLGTTGTDLSSTVANGTTTPVITLQVPTASATNRGALSAANWTTFNSKAPGVTFTTNYIPYGQGTTTLNQSAGLQFDGTNFTTTGYATATSFRPSASTVPTNGMYLPAANSVGIATNSTERIRIDSSGSMGLGVTPSAWVAASWKVLQIGSGASIAGRVVAGTEDQIYVSANAYNDGAWKYIGTNFAANYYQDNGEHVWRTAPSGTAGNAITWTTGMTLNASGGCQHLNTISVGNATPSTSGAGITFPATQSASTNANTLDDYEEGTWTPIDSSGASLSFTGTSGNCHYTKIGNQVTCVFNLVYPVTVSGAGPVIGGLPFTAKSTTNSVAGGFVTYTNSSLAFNFLVGSGGTTFIPYATNGVGFTNAQFSTFIFRGVITYFV